MNSEKALERLLNLVRDCNVKIPRMQIAELGDLYCVTAYDSEPTTIMANDVTTGMDFDINIATSKAIVEYLERKTFADGIKANDPICLHTDSDGMAAFPVFYDNHNLIARQNAYGEALERFVWAKWWDESYGHTVENFQNTQSSKSSLSKQINYLREVISFKNIFLVKPFQSDETFEVSILFLETNAGGFVTGGAAGKTSDSESVLVRAFSELLRHSIALSRFESSSRAPETFYEKRLVHFGFGNSSADVHNRLSRKSTRVVELPKLEIDSKLNGQFDTIISAHRCLFVDQPAFVGGELERLCL